MVAASSKKVSQNAFYWGGKRYMESDIEFVSAYRSNTAGSVVCFFFLPEFFVHI